MSEIALIPRAYRRMSKKERQDFAIKAKEQEEKSLSNDKIEIKKGASAFERKVAEDRAKLGLKPVTGNESQQHAYFKHGGNGKAYFINKARGNF